MKNKRPTQDDTRENEQIKIFDLVPGPGRSNKYVHDATVVVGGKEHQIELKTSDAARKLVSTSRNVTLSKLDEWRGVWWIFSQYKKVDTGLGFEFVKGEHYFAHGKDLEPFLAKVTSKIMKGTDFYGGLENWNQCKGLLEGQISPKVIERLNNSFNKRGCGLNDPRINWKDVEEMCIPLDDSRLAEHLRELIAEKVRGNK